LKLIYECEFESFLDKIKRSSHYLVQIWLPLVLWFQHVSLAKSVCENACVRESVCEREREIESIK